MYHIISVFLVLCCAAHAFSVETPAVTKPETIDLQKPGVYTSGTWTYNLRFFNAGTRSQATVGSLTKDGAEVPAPTDKQPLATPWGPMVYMGKRGDLASGGTPWGDFGWRPAAAKERTAKENDDPKGLIKQGSVAE